LSYIFITRNSFRYYNNDLFDQGDKIGDTSSTRRPSWFLKKSKLHLCIIWILLKRNVTFPQKIAKRFLNIHSLTKNMTTIYSKSSCTSKTNVITF